MFIVVGERHQIEKAGTYKKRTGKAIIILAKGEKRSSPTSMMEKSSLTLRKWEEWREKRKMKNYNNSCWYDPTPLPPPPPPPPTPLISKSRDTAVPWNPALSNMAGGKEYFLRLFLLARSIQTHHHEARKSV